jgi:hypothetical protein
MFNVLEAAALIAMFGAIFSLNKALLSMLLFIMLEE